jgi:hypothetical protein
LQNNDFRSVLQSVVLHWQQSAKAYAHYMENGKTFRYAEVLKFHNTSVKNLLTQNISIIPDDLRTEANAIIEHYTIWSAKWDDLKSKLNPGPDEVFVFENDHRFPKVAAQKMEAALKNLS